jgi:hypothetical protein
MNAHIALVRVRLILAVFANMKPPRRVQQRSATVAAGKRLASSLRRRVKN